jgi:hypothetical protein
MLNVPVGFAMNWPTNGQALYPSSDLNKSIHSAHEILTACSRRRTEADSISRGRQSRAETRFIGIAAEENYPPGVITQRLLGSTS